MDEGAPGAPGGVPAAVAALPHTRADVPVPRADVLDADCAAHRALALVADKWVVLVVYALADGPQRHMQLRRRIPAVTQKMLTQTLRRLEAAGLVRRHDHGTVPPAVDYALTPLGRTLLEPLSALCRWAEDHLDEVAVAPVG